MDKYKHLRSPGTWFELCPADITGLIAERLELSQVVKEKFSCPNVHHGLTMMGVFHDNKYLMKRNFWLQDTEYYIYDSNWNNLGQTLTGYPYLQPASSSLFHRNMQKEKFESLTFYNYDGKKIKEIPYPNEKAICKLLNTSDNSQCIIIDEVLLVILDSTNNKVTVFDYTTKKIIMVKENSYEDTIADVKSCGSYLCFLSMKRSGYHINIYDYSDRKIYNEKVDLTAGRIEIFSIPNENAFLLIKYIAFGTPSMVERYTILHEPRYFTVGETSV